MISIHNLPKEYEYDVYSLAKAFCPGEDICFIEGALDAGEDAQGTRYYVNLSEDSFKLEITDIESGDSRIYKEPAGEKYDYKNAWKLFYYNCLSDYYGRTLPWGNLTGIRPSKIIMKLMEDGMEDAAIYEEMENKHKVSPSKIQLGIDIAKREKKLLDPLDLKNGFSLYIGIPFCITRCLYCSFTSNLISKWEDKVDDYIDCLIKEMEGIRPITDKKVLHSVYIGGGTPTSITAKQLDRIIKAIYDNFHMDECLEFTCEAGRPDSFTKEKLLVLLAGGVKRISVNPQTMNDETLELIGRKHTSADIISAFNMARECGFDNINMDMILGLPGEDVEMVRKTLEAVSNLKPDSLTVHSLAVKRAAELTAYIEKKGYFLKSDLDEEMSLASVYADGMGMKPYYMYRQKNMAGNLENIGFSHDGKEGLYNILIMEEKEFIIALGAGSVTKCVYEGNRIERVDNAKDIKVYMERIDAEIKKKLDYLG